MSAISINLPWALILATALGNHAGIPSTPLNLAMAFGTAFATGAFVVKPFPLINPVAVAAIPASHFKKVLRSIPPDFIPTRPPSLNQLKNSC